VKWRECIAKGCNNHSDEGEFVMDLCRPCYTKLTSGKGRHGEAAHTGHLTERISLRLSRFTF
jgi:hypothetical protein